MLEGSSGWISTDAKVDSSPANTNSMTHADSDEHSLPVELQMLQKPKTDLSLNPVNELFSRYKKDNRCYSCDKDFVSKLKYRLHVKECWRLRNSGLEMELLNEPTFGSREYKNEVAACSSFDVGSESKRVSSFDLKSESVSESKSELTSVSTSESEFASASESKSASETESKSASEIESKSASETESKPASEIESKPASTNESRSASTSEWNPKSKPDLLLESKPEPNLVSTFRRSSRRSTPCNYFNPSKLTSTKLKKSVAMEPLHCETCTKTFASVSSLTRHLEQHITGSKPEFVCRICEKGFTRKFNLQRHQRNHTTGYQ